jgi:hypothetical protein
MMGLRTADGITAPGGFDPEIAQLLEAGLAVREGSVVRPTDRGLDLHNQIALTVL